MKIPVICSDYLFETCDGLGLNYSKTEKFADELLAKMLINNDILGSYTGLPLNIKSALFVGTTVGGLDRSETEYIISKTTDYAPAQKFIRHEAGKMTEYLAKKYKFDKYYTVSTACSSGLNAIMLAKHAIEKGFCEIAVAIGTDALCDLTKNGFDSLMLIAKNQEVRPFDKNRSGIKLNEGAGGIVLVSPKLVKNAEFYISGHGSSCDAYHSTAPHPEGRGAVAAIIGAIESSGINPTDIDWICSHATGTIDNDLAEVAAYRKVFNDKIPPFCSFKGKIAHTLAASGTIETAMAICDMRENKISKTVGFSDIDEQIGIAPTTENISCNAKFVLKVSFGFGGNNSAIIIEKG